MAVCPHRIRLLVRRNLLLRLQLIRYLQHSSYRAGRGKDAYKDAVGVVLVAVPSTVCALWGGWEGLCLGWVG